ncbi:MAG: hypothetical protein M1133_12785 [Armatimonadetes bacterium]|nr:hypothetical protein [Armatimonadota bacterium]
MFRTKRAGKMFGLIIVAVALGSAALLGGCGNSNTSDTSAPMGGPSAETPQTKMPAAGPAITTKLKFDQMALRSEVTRYQNKNGQTFLRFAYSDKDGKVYKCELPEAMAKGEYTPDEWTRTFDLCKLPEVVKQDTSGKNKTEKGLKDFPFISPNPNAPQQPNAGAQPPMPQGNP